MNIFLLLALHVVTVAPHKMRRRFHSGSSRQNTNRNYSAFLFIGDTLFINIRRNLLSSGQTITAPATAGADDGMMMTKMMIQVYTSVGECAGCL